MEVLNKIYNWFILKSNKNKYESLAPIDTIKENENASLEMLKNAISDSHNHNIALSGKFGAGKSSIVNSLFKGIRRFFYRPINISLGMLDLNGVEANQVEEFCQQIEKSIIQQIIYKEKKSKLSDSNIKRVSKLSKRSIVYVLLIIIGIVAFKISTLYIIDYKEKIREILDLYINLNIASKFIIAVIVILIAIKVAVCITKVIKKIDIKNMKFNFCNTEIETSKDSSESLINRYMDELVYYFTKTKYNVVVIEDLDRFLIDENIRKRVLIIFQKLKELNQILNSSKEIKRRIVFLYVAKDDIFRNDEERTKFFDIIVPVIPITSNYNSYAELKNRFEQYDIGDKIIQEVSPYINDLRVIKSIKNEFDVYQKERNGKEITIEKLFAMIVFKNIRPNEYEKLLNNEGKVFDCLKQKKEFININQDQLVERINSNNEKIEEFKKEKLSSIEEIKKLALGCLYGKRGNRGANSYITAEAFLTEKFNYEYIDKNVINIKDPNTGNCFDESEIFAYFGGKVNFLERLKLTSKEYEQEIDRIIAENNKMEKELEKMYQKPLYKLLEKSSQIGIEDKFIKMLVMNGYIDENYQDYMFKYKETKEMSKHDYSFVSRVRQYTISYDYEYTINNAEAVINQLNKEFFGTESILNYDILDKLLIEESVEKNEKLEAFLKMLSDLTDSKERFIFGFWKRSKNIDIFISKLHSIDNSVLYELLIRNSKNKPRIEMIIKSILNNPELIDNLKIQEFVKNYLENKHSFSNWVCINDNVKESLLKLDVKFIELNNEDSDFIKFIYENELYRLNTKMVGIMFTNKGILHNDFESKNLSTIMNDGRLKELKKYVEENKEEYIRDCYLKTLADGNNLSDIIMCINTWELGNELVEAIIDNMPVINVPIQQLNEQYWNYILEKNKIEPRWENYFYCYKNNESKFTKVLLEKIEINFNVLKEQDLALLMIQEDVKDSFRNFQEALQRNNTIRLDIYRGILELFKIKLNNVNIDEVQNERLTLLVNKNLIIFDNDNMNVINKQLPELVAVFIKNNINEFFDQINELQLNQEIVNIIITSDQISYRNKNKVLNIISVDYLNEDSLEYIIKNNSQNRISSINQEIKDRIFNSSLKNETKLILLKNELQKNVSLDIIKKYMESLDSSYCNIGNNTGNKYNSIPNNKDNISVLNLLKKAGLNISFTVKKKVIVVCNKK